MDDDAATEPYPGYWDDLAASVGPFAPRDPVDHVTDVATLIALHTAEQYASVAALRRESLHDAGSYATAEMVDRSVRLELASALRVTEYAAGELMRHATALVERYPRALEALRRAGITDQPTRTRRTGTAPLSAARAARSPRTPRAPCARPSAGPTARPSPRPRRARRSRSTARR